MAGGTSSTFSVDVCHIYPASPVPFSSSPAPFPTRTLLAMRPTLPLLALGLAAPAAHAWGNVGHSTVALLAAESFSPASTRLLAVLLGDVDDGTLCDAATWADAVRKIPGSGFTKTGPWHYIDAFDDPPEECGVRYNRDCPPAKGCAVSAITNQTGILLNTTQADAPRAVALKFLLHIIGDIHQPMHTEALGYGGNTVKVCFDSLCERVNLHAIWDDNIINKHRGLSNHETRNATIAAAQQWAAALDADSPVPVAGECTDVRDPATCALEWANEANAFVCSYVLAPGVDWLKSHDLGGDYYEGAVPIVTTQITRAAARLAAWLNAISAELAERVDL